MDNNVVSTSSDELLVNRNIKDSVFRNLFSDKKYLFQLYQALHVVFTKVINDQVKIYGRTREAITEAIRICKDRNILKDYLTSREKEVVDIMITLFDQQEVLEDYIASDRREQAMDYARTLYDSGVSIEIIAKTVKQSVKTVERWLGLVPQAF